MAAKPIPDGFHTATPYLCIKGATDAIAFYKHAFHAKEIFVMPTPTGEIGHAELLIGNSHIMMSDYCPESPTQSPEQLNGSSIGIYLYVEDVDALFTNAIAAGAKEVSPVADQFYGDRMGILKDPFGHVWFISTHKEDLSPEELGKRAAELFGGA